MAACRPWTDRVYTLRRVLSLDLLDSPSLGFTWRGHQHVIQTSHLTDAELLAVPALANTQWRYMRTTHEWIPVFELVSPVEDLLRCLDIVLYHDSVWDCHDTMVTPKGHPRELFIGEHIQQTFVRQLC
jgi:hypothetical protein